MPEAVERQSAGTAKATARALTDNAQYVGAIAFQGIGYPDEGEFGDAAIIERYGETPRDLSAL